LFCCSKKKKKLSSPSSLGFFGRQKGTVVAIPSFRFCFVAARRKRRRCQLCCRGLLF
jgi:hypothetical protein